MDHMGNSQVFEGYYEFSRFFSPHWNWTKHTLHCRTAQKAGELVAKLKLSFKKVWVLGEKKHPKVSHVRCESCKTSSPAKSSPEASNYERNPPLFVLLVKFED